MACDTRTTSSRTPRFIRSSSASLLTLQSLPEPCMLVLFTPAMPTLQSNPDPKDKSEDAADPLEPLGRALALHHKRVRHVPYVPKVGLTDLHLPFIRQAHMIIVVICEPPGSLESKKESIANQEKFTEDTVTSLYTMRPTDSVQVTLSLIRCGGDGCVSQQPKFANVVQCTGYWPHDQEAAAGLLMGV